MPSKDFGRVSPTATMTNTRNVSAEWLLEQLRLPAEDLPLILDFRPTTDFHSSHIRHAINVTLPTLLLRRLANDKLKVAALIKATDSRQRFSDHWKTHTVILCGNRADSSGEDSNGGADGGPVLNTLYRILDQEGANVVSLKGGFSDFRSKFPEWCTSDDGLFDPEAPILGISSLCIASSSSSSLSSSVTSSEEEGSESDDLEDSCLGRETPSFPVQILPFLYLGNAENSADLDALRRHKIAYILNVTQDLPNIFEHEGDIKYLQIPISDHWSQDLATFFPEAIAFIEEARKNETGVLVHCLAGISRSVTITVAYLMHRFSMPLNAAYDYVKKRKANISPNLNFMGQLLDYEKQLGIAGSENGGFTQQPRIVSGEIPTSLVTGTQFLTPTPTRTTPDSGIDFESWV